MKTNSIQHYFLLVCFLIVGLSIISTPAFGDACSEPVSLEVIEIHSLPESEDQAGTASVTFRIKSGQSRGDTIIYSTTMWGHPQYDHSFKTGKTFTGERVFNDQGELQRLILHHDRKDYKLLILFGIVTLVLFVIGRWEGLIGLFSTVVTVLMIFYVFFPLLDVQKAIFPVGIMVCLITIVLTVSFVMKWDTPAIPAIFSLVTVFFIILGLTIFGFGFLSLDATSARHSRLILTWIDQPDSLWQLLTIGIVLGTLGAMMDVAVVISSTVNEIVRDSETIDLAGAFRSGLKVGREILSTMLNTLVFAYLGILFPIFLSFRIFDLSWLQFINYDFVGIEILRLSIGLVGLSLIIPFTALASAWWCRRR